MRGTSRRARARSGETPETRILRCPQRSRQRADRRCQSVDIAPDAGGRLPHPLSAGLLPLFENHFPDGRQGIDDIGQSGNVDHAPVVSRAASVELTTVADAIVDQQASHGLWTESGFHFLIGAHLSGRWLPLSIPMGECLSLTDLFCGTFSLIALSICISADWCGYYRAW